MIKMASSQGICLSFFMLMIIGMVNGRWLEADTLSTSMISDGVPRTVYENPPNLRMVVSNSSEYSTTKLYAQERCNSIYGFLPCADTMQEGVFLMLMYTYLMMLGEEWIHKGSEALFVLLGDKAFGASVFRVLMALPRIIIVIVSGVLATASDAQNQVAFGVGMYAGSTIISLTLIWGFRIILSRDKLRGKEPTLEIEHQYSSTKCLSLKQIHSVLNDTGVNIDDETGSLAVIMLLSMIPFATVELVTLLHIPGTILFALMVSSVSLLLCFAHQMWSPWIQSRSLAYLKQENLQTRFFYHVQRLAEDDLIDEHGNPNLKAFESIFIRADTDNDDCISEEELEHLIQKVFELEKDQISKEYAKAEILTHFDSDKSGKINGSEFKKGCTKWLEKWKNVANNSDSVSKNLWKQVEKVAIKSKRSNLTKIERIMPRILKQVFEKHQLLTEDGIPDRKKIEELFIKYDEDGNQVILQNELKQFIKTLHFGVSLDHDTVVDEIVNDFDNDGSSSIQKKEFVDGFVRWIEKAIGHDPSIKDPKHAIAKFEEDSWGDIDAHTNLDYKPRASILYIVFGVGFIYLISGAFMQSVIQFSTAAHIPFLFTSFVMAPIAMNTKMIITALLHAGPRASKNASLTFSEIYSGLVMNNLLGLTTLLITVQIKGLSWSYSAEVLAIMIPCIIVGLFAFNRDTYPLWASIFAMLLYPVSIYLYYVFES